MRNLKNTQNYHMDSNGWSDIGYNYLIGQGKLSDQVRKITFANIPFPDGRIYEGRGPHRQGAHCSHWNVQTLGFSIMGDFSHELPNEQSIAAADQLIQYLKRQGYINPSCYEFYGHRDKGNTVCPGDPLYARWSTWENWHRTCL